MTDIAGERQRLAQQGLDIIYREQWGAQQSYTSDRRVNRPASWLFLHITVTADPADTVAAESAACRQVEAIGQQRFGIGWSYNAGVMQSGRLYEGQPLTRRGAHTVNDLPNPNFPTGSLNYDARALALVQNVQDAVTDAQIDSAARWGAALRRSGEAVGNARWFGHRDVTQKSCPGPIGYARLPQLNSLTDHYTRVGLGTSTPPTLESLMPFPVIASPPGGGLRPWTALLPGKIVRFVNWDPLPDSTPDEQWQHGDLYWAGADAKLYAPVETVDSVVNYDRACLAAKQCVLPNPREGEWATRLVAIQQMLERDELITVIAPPSDTGDGRYWAALMDGYVRIFNAVAPDNLDPQTVWCPNEEYNLGVGVLYKTVLRVPLRNYDVMVASAKRRPAESPPPP